VEQVARLFLLVATCDAGRPQHKNNRGEVECVIVDLDVLMTLHETAAPSHQTTSQQEISALQAELLAGSQKEAHLNREFHQLQEQFDTQKREKAALQTALEASEKARDKLNTQHTTALQQIENAKHENQRLHTLASQIQANLEHYQQAIQQQQVEHNLTKEQQHAVYAQELEQLKIALEESKKQHDNCEKERTATQFKLEKTLVDHDQLIERYEGLLARNQATERTLAQLQAHELSYEKQREETCQALLTERQLTQSLHQQIAVFNEQLQRTQKDLHQAEDKVESLRHEKMFLVQEKGQLEGALKQLQKADGVV
jgi:chromosome segregation ATPase